MTANFKNYADVWKELPWKSLEKSLYILQHRIYKATKNNNIVRVKKLQRLLIYSKASKFLAVKQLTHLNSEETIHKVNGIYHLSVEQKLALANSIRINPSEEQAISRVFGFKRQPLTNLEIRDKVHQCILQYALEPVYEAQVSSESCRFRLAKNEHDIQTIVMKNIRSNSTSISKTILEIDLENCFDKINYSKLLSLITLPSFAAKVLKKMLLIGVFHEKRRLFDETHKMGIIFSLLTNIALLHGLEDIHKEQRHYSIVQKGIRHGNKILFFLQDWENDTSFIYKICTLLVEKGLKISQPKTRVFKIINSFDFLGWTFKVNAKSGKYLCYPDSKSMQNLSKKIKSEFTNSKYSLEKRLIKIKLFYQGWLNYHKYCDLSRVTLWSIKKWSYQYLTKNSSFSSKKRFDIIQSVFQS